MRDEVLTRPLSGSAAAMWHGNLALFMAEAGLDAPAREYLARLGARDDTGLTQTVDGRSAAALGAEACALLQDERLAPRLYELLVPRDGLCILGGRGVYFRGAAARYLGLLAATLGRTDAAVRHHEDALETNARAQAPPWVARSLLDLARALLARDGPGDQQRAGDLLGRAEPLARRAGHASSRGASDARTLRVQRLRRPKASSAGARSSDHVRPRRSQTFRGTLPVRVSTVRIALCPRSAVGPNMHGQPPSITAMPCSRP